jgi:Family of unknown function (DUF6350)
MTEPARPAERTPPGWVLPAIRAGLLGGFLAFAAATCLGVAIGLSEFAASGGAYRLWTWVKVGFLYVVSFATASLRATVVAPGEAGTGVPQEIRLRFSLLLGTVLILWLLSLAGRRVARSGSRPAAVVAGAVAGVVGFSVPVFAIALPATLRFPGALRVEVSPVLWQAALYPVLIAGIGLAAGVGLERRDRIPRAVEAAVRGGWRMLVSSLVLAFLGFLSVAALKEGATGAYAREMQAEGRVGALSVTHHLLLLPDQSVWILAPSMGGSTHVSFGGAARTVVSIDRVELGSVPRYVMKGRLAEPSVPLGGGFYLFLLVPAVATVLGGRAAGAASSRWPGRSARGAAAGVVFAALVAAAAWASAITVPIPAAGWTPVSVQVAMPSTVALALTWGVVGGALGGLSSALGARTPSQAGVPVPEPG